MAGTLGTVVKYSAVLIGTYLVVAHATDTGTLITKAGKAGSGYVRVLQGRG